MLAISATIFCDEVLAQLPSCIVIELPSEAAPLQAPTGAVVFDNKRLKPPARRGSHEPSEKDTPVSQTPRESVFASDPSLATYCGAVIKSLSWPQWSGTNDPPHRWGFFVCYPVKGGGPQSLLKVGGPTV